MSRPYCGIDFGTSNSAVCVGVGEDVRLLAVEGTSNTLPSAIFFNTELDSIAFGREAIAQYLDHYEGRLMRALKSILGSALIGETTQVGSKRKDFREIIGLYIGHLKSKAEAHFWGGPSKTWSLGGPCISSTAMRWLTPVPKPSLGPLRKRRALKISVLNMNRSPPRAIINRD